MMSKQDTNAIRYGDESDHDLISMEIIEDIRDGSQSHPNVNRREARYMTHWRCNYIRTV